MKSYNIFNIILFFLLCSCATTKSITRPDGEKLSKQQLDQKFKSSIESLEIPGLSVAIINAGNIVYHQVFGKISKDSTALVTQQSIFEGASLSKPIFAYFVLKLAEAGLIDLDQPLHEVLPHPAIKDERYKLITPRIVLAHQTGFPNWNNGKEIELAFTPGEGFSYSGEAYQYLTAFIGTKLGTGYESGLDSVFQEMVAKPLGLNNTFFTWNDYIEKNKVMGHEKGITTQNKERHKVFGAGYSLHSEARDYAAFIAAMINEKGLAPQLYQLMVTEQTAFSPENPLREYGQSGWTLGLAMRPSKDGMWYLHTGNNHDFQSFCAFNKEMKWGFVFFMNADKAEPFFEEIEEKLGIGFFSKKS
ncbi:serine hydrolase domain-containing protein [Ekhidna sp.]|uniref:serine hydrolase domain-containing protein n=1 Tax=Ekhidna sp. TaxID=2608089 RepID=UPI0032F08489